MVAAAATLPGAMTVRAACRNAYGRISRVSPHSDERSLIGAAANMHGHPHPGKPRHHTAPSRLRKRDVPAVWDLFALDDRANASARDDDDASSVASLSHPPSIASLGSFASEDTQQSDSFHHNGPPMLSSGGSWPRIRKQRTSEMGGSMSLFEVAEALGADEISADADLASLAKLVAEEEQEMASSSAPTEGEATNVSIESFVDAVFKGITPGSSSSAQSQAVSSTAATSTAEHPPAAPKPSSRPHTANELALLEALKQDQAAQEALKGGGGGNPTNPGPPRKNTSSPTFAALDESAETFLDENAEAADDMVRAHAKPLL